MEVTTHEPTGFEIVSLLRRYAPKEFREALNLDDEETFLSFAAELNKPMLNEDAAYELCRITALSLYWANHSDDNHRASFRIVKGLYLQPVVLRLLVQYAQAEKHFDVDQLTESIKSKIGKGAADIRHLQNNQVKIKVLTEYLAMPKPRKPKKTIAVDFAKRIMAGEFGKHNLGTPKDVGKTALEVIIDVVEKNWLGYTDSNIKNTLDGLQKAQANLQKTSKK